VINKTVVTVNDKREGIPLMVDMAWKYRKDWAGISSEIWLPRDYDFLESLEFIFELAQARYTLEEGEQFLRPWYFFQIGGDCDDQAIFILSYLFYIGMPADRTYIVEAGNSEDNVYHIFIAVEITINNKPKLILMDAIPGYKFDSINYPFYRFHSIL